MAPPVVRAVAVLLLCSLAQLHLGGCDEQAAATTQGSKTALAQPDYSIYLRKDDLLAKVREVVNKHPDIMKYETRHAKDEEYKADVMVVTVEPAGLSPMHKSKARLLLDFGEHGREFITSEVGLRLLQVLGDPEQLSKLVGGGKRAARLKAILEHCVFKILPMENVAGRDIVEAGNLCERKNGRGVDPNRNWDIDWGVKEKDYDPKEEYPGKAALSEPEVQVLLALAKELHPHVWLNVHSGMYALFTPYDHKGHVPNTTDARAALRMMKRIRDLACPQCKVGSGGHTVGYLAHGTATDYMFEVLKVPMSFTWEIYGDENASYEDCFKMFNPLGQQHFEEVATLWVKALLQLVELLPTHPATWPFFKQLGLARWEAVAPKGNATEPQQPQDAAATPPAATAATPPAPAVAAPAADQAAAAAADGSKPSPSAQGLLPSIPAVEEEEQETQPAPAAAAATPPAQQLPQQPIQQPPAQHPSAAQAADKQEGPAAAAAATPQPTKATEAPTVVEPQPAADVTVTPPQPTKAAEVPTAAEPQPEKLQQPSETPKIDADISTDVSLEEHLGAGSNRGSDWVLVFMSKVLPWAIGLGGFAAVLYCVTRERGPGYSRLPIRQPSPPSRTPARR